MELSLLPKALDHGRLSRKSRRPAFLDGDLPYPGQAFTLMARQASSTSAKLGR